MDMLMGFRLKAQLRFVGTPARVDALRLVGRSEALLALLANASTTGLLRK